MTDGGAGQGSAKWSVTVAEAVALQRELRGRLVRRPPEGFSPGLVGGADISLERDSPHGYAGIVVIDRGEVVGMALRLRAGTKPVYVSPGHLMDLPTAVDVVLAMSAGYREPETTRRSHRLVNRARLEARKRDEV